MQLCKYCRYTEFAAEFGPSKALRPQSCDMSFIEYHNLDIIAIALFVTLITLIIVAHIAIKIVKRVFRKSSTKQKRS